MVPVTRRKGIFFPFNLKMHFEGTFVDFLVLQQSGLQVTRLCGFFGLLSCELKVVYPSHELKVV